MARLTQDELLELKFESRDLARTLTIAEFFRELMLEFWFDPEGFNGKRPFGNGGWEFDIYAGLIKAGAVAGELDEEGCVNDVDQRAADELVTKLLKRIFRNAALLPKIKRQSVELA